MFRSRTVSPCAGAALLALGLACGGGGAVTGSAPAGTAQILVTDAPSDTWSTVQVQVTGVTLVNQADQSRTVAFSGAASLNLVDLDSVGELLASAQVPAGTYDKLIITVNPDPATITLIPEGATTPVAAGRIHVVGNGVTTVDLSPALTVTADGSNAVQVDFDLAHPLFINQLPSGDVTLNFQVRHKPNPALLRLVRLHRSLGAITAVDGAAGRFTAHTQHGRDLTFGTDANTLFYDVDARPFSAGSFNGLAPTDAVMVAARLQDDGSLYAVRVWYCAAANAALRPVWRWAPEGHVVSVDPANQRMVVDNADGMPRTVTVDAGTVFTFHDSLPASGQITLADLRRGFKVAVAVRDPLAAPMVASAVDIERAVDSGYLDSATSTSLTYGQAALANLRSYPLSPAFTWWDFAQPAQASADPAAFAAALLGAGTTRAFGASSLTWDAAGSAWNAETAVLLPVVLPAATIAQGYDAAAGTMRITYTDPLSAGPVTRTVQLSAAAGGGQTLVLKVTQQGGVTTSALDLPADWAADLGPGAQKVWLSVVPQASGNLAAYSVVVLE